MARKNCKLLSIATSFNRELSAEEILASARSIRKKISKKISNKMLDKMKREGRA